ncbi:MAG: alpha-L-fucosidase, partial [Kiritimatiellae bacterium]|nr:alpha-L-fucosidase [Kiritimatiellia bacterium]
MLTLKKRLSGERRWFEEARLGLFIHYGPYSLRGVNENEFMSGGVEKKEYARLRDRFNPRRFDAYEWASLARDNGFRYLVVTVKHTDGFCMWDTRHTQFRITRTPFQRDLFGELAEACHRTRLRFGVYYSFGDAYYEEPGEGTPEGRTYAGYVKAQYRELMTLYGRIDCLWHDAPDRRLSDDFVTGLTDWVHKVQPSCVVNSRGLGSRQHNPHADFVTPERYIPQVPLRHCPVECCDSMGQFAWGYRKVEQYWSAPELIRRLSRVASFHGNYLLNVGPMPDGRFPPPCVERMRALGRWLRTHGEAVFGTEACELRPHEGYPAVLHDQDVVDELPAIGVATRARNTVYLHLHQWPRGDTLLLPHVRGTVKRASLLGRRGTLPAHCGRVSRFGVDTARGNYGQAGIVVGGLPSEPVGADTAIVKLDLAPGWRVDEAALKRERTRWVV